MPCLITWIEPRSIPKISATSSAEDSETVMTASVLVMARCTRPRQIASWRLVRATSIYRLATPWTVVTEGARVGSMGPVSEV